jgi:hypothetical protein
LIVVRCNDGGRYEGTQRAKRRPGVFDPGTGRASRDISDYLVEVGEYRRPSAPPDDTQTGRGSRSGAPRTAREVMGWDSRGFWQPKHEEYPDRCECGYDASMLWIPAERSAHASRHRSYLKGKKLTKTFPYERIADNIIHIPGEETGTASRAVYFLARDFNRQYGFDFILWPYMGDYPMSEPGHHAYLYVLGGHAVGTLLGKTGDYYTETGEDIPGVVRLIYTAGGHRRKGIARALALRFAKDLDVSPAALLWEGPITKAGAETIKSISGESALVC